WLQNNIKERWEKRLDVSQQGQPADVLVLKTEYNTAWNYFNAKDLTDTMFGYWRTWLDKADRREFNSEFPEPPEDYEDEVDCHARLSTRFGTSYDDSLYIPDLRKIDILNRRIITSRKRTRNLFDLTGLWKKIVLEKLDERLPEEVTP
ncbi:hypothetical protein BV22DRAFT_990151, partial [Leucogyrophana mollusca]